MGRKKILLLHYFIFNFFSFFAKITALVSNINDISNIVTPLLRVKANNNGAFVMFFLTGYSMPHTLHKHRRSPLPTLSSSLPHSSLHALLLDCLANAGADESFPTLEHHLFVGDLSVRHAAVRGLRNYATDEVRIAQY